MRKTKIIATLGPVTFSKEKISSLIECGVNVFRINMSHSIPLDLLENIVKCIRKESRAKKVSVSILFDLCGPKIRVKHKNKNKVIIIESNKTYSLGFGDNNISLNIPIEFSDITNDSQIKIDDGNLTFEIIEIHSNYLIIRALDSGEINGNKGVNFPGIELNIPTFTKKDEYDLKMAAKLKVDWIAMSFVRHSNDINAIKKNLKDLDVTIPIIAKVEKQEAITNLNSIINVFDGVLVARGDLGVEMPVQELPVFQKRIVKACLKNNKPVIIATQMLESMIHNSSPTRAEVNDIANAIYDGADAVMLSAETAIGSYPIESVKMMVEIADSIEKDLDEHNFSIPMRRYNNVLLGNRTSICHSAMVLSDNLKIKSIVIMTESGQTAITMAQCRPRANIYALCAHQSIFQLLSLVWGVVPILVKSFSSTDEMIDASGKILKQMKLLKKQDQFIITAGAPVGISGTTNMIKIHQID